MIEKLIKKIAFNLDKAKIPYMIIGGQAVLLYGVPRLTRDIDITLILSILKNGFQNSIIFLSKREY